MKKIVIEDTVQGRIIRLSIERDATAEQIVDKLKKRYKGLREQDLVLLHGEALLEAGDIALDKVKNDGGGKAARFELCMVELDEERKATMVDNLLVVLCGKRAAQPMTSCAASTPRSNFCCARR